MESQKENNYSATELRTEYSTLTYKQFKIADIKIHQVIKISETQFN